jgi:O-antigen/teichoic acid export membrane protein
VLFLLIGAARGEIRWDVQLAALIASSQFFGETMFLVGAVFQAQLRAYLDVAPRILYAACRFALTLVLLALGVPWWALFLAWVGGYALAGSLAVLLLRLRSTVRPRPHIRDTGPLVREALTLGVAGLLGMATVQFGTIYLGVTSPPETVAVFNAAILPIQYLSLFGSVVAIVAFPLVSAAWGRRDLVAFARIDATARTAILALFLPVSVLLFQTPLTGLLEGLFGEGYGEAAAPLRLMSIALILASVVVWAGFVFLAIGRPRLILVVNLLCLAAGVAACTVVVPRWGLPGLGAVGIGATALGTVVAAVLLRRFAPYSLDVRAGLRVLLSGALLWGALELAGAASDHFLVHLAVVLALYPLLLVATGAFPRSLLDELRSHDAPAGGDGLAVAAGESPEVVHGSL